MAFTVPWHNPLYTDNPGLPKRVSMPVLSSPVPRVTTPYILTEKWRDFAKTWTPGTLNTIHDVYSVANGYSRNFFLVSESERADVGCGFVEWTKTFAAVPDPHFEAETFLYNRISYISIDALPGSTVQRNSAQEFVTSRIKYEYFLTGPGGTYTDFSGIPVVLAMRYVYQSLFAGRLQGGVLTQILVPSTNSPPTYPSSEQYEAMIRDALQNGWAATTTNEIIFTTDTSSHFAGTIDPVNSVLGGIICAETSRLDQWQGNIFRRRTRFVLAQ